MTWQYIPEFCLTWGFTFSRLLISTCAFSPSGGTETELAELGSQVAVQALDVERHMLVQHIVHQQDARHDDHLPQPLLVALMRSPAPLPDHAARRSEAKPH